MLKAIKKPRLINNTPTIADASEQYAMARDMYQEDATTETNANMLRAYMVLKTKQIELSPEELEELRANKGA